MIWIDNIKDYIEALFEKFRDRVDRNKEDLRNLNQDFNAEVKEIRDKLSKLENRQSVAENNINNINEKLNNIEAGVIWTKRTVIGAIIVQVINMLVNSGGVR